MVASNRRQTSLTRAQQENRVVLFCFICLQKFMAWMEDVTTKWKWNKIQDRSQGSPSEINWSSPLIVLEQIKARIFISAGEPTSQEKKKNLALARVLAGFLVCSKAVRKYPRERNPRDHTCFCLERGGCLKFSSSKKPIHEVKQTPKKEFSQGSVGGWERDSWWAGII